MYTYSKLNNKRKDNMTKTTTDRLTKIEQLATLIEEQSKERYLKKYGRTDVHLKACITSVKLGNKYTKIDRGGSGYLMIDNEGNIFGIKAYGVIHKGHNYGTLDTIEEYNWGGYTAKKKF